MASAVVGRRRGVAIAPPRNAALRVAPVDTSTGAAIGYTADSMRWPFPLFGCYRERPYDWGLDGT